MFLRDPIGINFKTNTDEYDAEAGTVIPRLEKCSSSDDVAIVVHEEFKRKGRLLACTTMLMGFTWLVSPPLKAAAPDTKDCSVPGACPLIVRPMYPNEQSAWGERRTIGIVLLP
jgi:hypothetical protein